MFTIDLLKGQGVPAKSRPEGIAATAIMILVPLVMTAVMFGGFFVNKVNMSVAKNKIAYIEKELDSGILGTVLKKQIALEQETEILSGSLSDVSDALAYQTQWSPFLEAIIKNMPQSVVLKAVDVKKDNKKIKMVSRDAKDTTTEVAVPIRILHLSLTSNQQSNFDQVVKNYRDGLLADPVVGPKLEDVKVAQEYDRVGDKNVISYEVYLVFKPQI